MFPNPPQIRILLKGQIFTVFLNLLPNSNLGSPSALYRVAVAGYYPEITINYYPSGVQQTSCI
jgi:hypothetical protein